MSKIEANEKPYELRHVREALYPLLEHYDKETSILIYTLNDSKKITYWIPDKIRCVLKKRGYRRAYLRYFISIAGYFETTGHDPAEPLFEPMPDFRYRLTLQNVSKIFFAYGNPPDSVKEFIERRVAEEKKRILDFNPDAEFFYFGDLTPEGYPKSLDDITDDDAENKFNGGRQ